LVILSKIRVKANKKANNVFGYWRISAIGSEQERRIVAPKGVLQAFLPSQQQAR
jgi:hypothetical protein